MPSTQLSRAHRLRGQGNSTHTANGQSSQKGGHLKASYVHKTRTLHMLRFRGRMAGMEGEDKAGGGRVVHGEQSACKKAWTLAGKRPSLEQACLQLCLLIDLASECMLLLCFSMIITDTFCCLCHDTKLFLKCPSSLQRSTLWGRKSNGGPYSFPRHLRICSDGDQSKFTL